MWNRKRLRAAPEVPVRPHFDGPEIMGATRRVLARSGYDLKKQSIFRRYRNERTI